MFDNDRILVMVKDKQHNTHFTNMTVKEARDKRSTGQKVIVVQGTKAQIAATFHNEH